jgi:uncharacterized protein (TIGR00255 family)
VKPSAIQGIIRCSHHFGLFTGFSKVPFVGPEVPPVMIYSMTGFAAAAREFEYGAITVEVRTVNHRYLEIQLRLPDELRGLETTLREAVVAQISRGKVDCRLTYTPKTGVQSGATLDREVLARLARYSQEIRQAIPDALPLTVFNVLSHPGVLGDNAAPLERLATDIRQLVRESLRDLNLSRQREGEKLKGFLLERVARMEELTRDVAPRIPGIIAAYQERLATRVREAGVSVDAERLHQEVVLFASKVDVEEELSRLHAHLSEIRNVLGKDGQAGKRLDFLMQELNRESNTLGAKSVATDVSRTSVELKVLIEQMREQVQNIE